MTKEEAVLTAEEAEVLEKEAGDEENEELSESFETEDEAEPIGSNSKALMSPSKVAIAKQEKERLKRLKQERKDALEKYRASMNMEAMKDEKTRARDRMRFVTFPPFSSNVFEEQQTFSFFSFHEKLFPP